MSQKDKIVQLATKFVEEQSEENLNNLKQAVQSLKESSAFEWIFDNNNKDFEYCKLINSKTNEVCGYISYVNSFSAHYLIYMDYSFITESKYNIESLYDAMRHVETNSAFQINNAIVNFDIEEAQQIITKSNRKVK